MKSKLFLFAFSLVLLAGLVVFSRASAQSPTPIPVTDDQVNAVAKTLYCPVCENIPLDVCPTQACQQWRALIREKLSQNWTTEQIRQYFAAQYGDRVLAEPPVQGLNLMVYVLPPVFILGGVFIVYRILRGRRKPNTMPASAPQSSGEKDPYVARMEEELRQRSKK